MEQLEPRNLLLVDRQGRPSVGSPADHPVVAYPGFRVGLDTPLLEGSLSLEQDFHRQGSPLLEANCLLEDTRCPVESYPLESNHLLEGIHLLEDSLLLAGSLLR